MTGKPNASVRRQDFYSALSQLVHVLRVERTQLAADITVARRRGCLVLAADLSTLRRRVLDTLATAQACVQDGPKRENLNSQRRRDVRSDEADDDDADGDGARGANCTTVADRR